MSNMLKIVIKPDKFKFAALIIMTIFCFVALLYKRSPLRQRFNYETLFLTKIDEQKVEKEKLGDFNEFQFLIDNDVCGGNSNVYMLILVGSHPSHVELRNVLRSTIGRPNIEGRVFKIVFAFGNLSNPADQQKIIKENEENGDIIQGNFIDAYKNVTLRDLMALRWSWRRCPQAKYIMRLDDDTSVDIFSIVNILDNCCSAKNAFIGCYVVWKEAVVLRDGRYAVTTEDHPQPIYNDYCNGWMYIVTPLMAYLLDNASSSVECYWMNDCYITGDLIKWLGLEHTVIEMRYTDNVQQMRNMLNKNPIRTYNLGPTNANPNLTLELFNLYKRKAFNELT
ncbi:hypothetical protein CHUAL_001877 [Chamberlinius hualienensis]